LSQLTVLKTRKATRFLPLTVEPKPIALVLRGRESISKFHRDASMLEIFA